MIHDRQIQTQIENNKIILYESIDKLNNYWTIPLNKPDINDSIIETILYNNMK